MQTDKQIFEVFQAAPWLLVDLLQIPNRSNCQYVSMTVKAIAKESDGVLVFEDDSECAHVIEWQFYSEVEIYNRIVIAMASLQFQFASQRIQGTIVFSHRSIDPQTEPWRSIIRTVFLEEILDELRMRSGAHPLLALFEPVIELQPEKLYLTLPACYNDLQSADFPQPAK